MEIKHIDSSFYRLTAAQAKALSIEGRLPRIGHEIRADPEKLKNVHLLHRQRGQWVNSTPGMAAKAHAAWIKRTPVSWHDGATVPNGWTWAVHLYFSAA